MNVAEKAAYIKGLMDGLKIDTESGEGKVLAAMADLLEDISLSILDLEDETATLNDYVDELDQDLGEVEEELYSLPYPDDCCCDDDDCCCDDEDDDEFCECLELTCPKCGEPVYIDECDVDDIDTLECPSCGETLELVEIDDEEDGESEEK